MKFDRLTLLAVATAAFALLFAQPGPALAVTFTVNSTGDAGDLSPDGVCDSCTLREAIQEANFVAGADVINFNVPGAGPHTIAPASALPTITQPVTIDGFSQPGSSPNTNPITTGSNAVMKIVLNGAGAGTGVNGLSVDYTAVGTTIIRGLVINGFLTAGGTNGSGIVIQNADGVLVQGNYIGTDVTGTMDVGNAVHGVAVLGGASLNNVIGGTNAGDRNVISANGGAVGTGSGVLLTGTLTGTGHAVAGNFIGTTAGGNSALGNDDAGIALLAGFGCIGGIFAGGVCTPSLAARNVISANGAPGPGIALQGAQGNQILGNYIGVGADGVTALGNTIDGINMHDSSPGNNTVGGTDTAAQNRIAFNTVDGVHVGFGSTLPQPTGNAIRGNAIYSNGALGIDLHPPGITPNDSPPDADTGPNNRQNFPVLTSAVAGPGSTLIQGSLTSAFNTTYTIDVYANNACDPSGNGEGETWLGSGTVTTNLAGTTPINFAVGPLTGQFVTATATDPSGNTSEFSACVTASGNTGVDTTSDANLTACTFAAGDCSLRGAINNANALAGADVINFNIPGAGPHTMAPTSALPTITEPVTIDGFSQPGASPNTNPITTGSNAVMKIVLNGANAGSNVSGLVVDYTTAGTTTIRGLVINGFRRGSGCNCAGVLIQQADGVVVQGNYIGTDASGSIVVGNEGLGVLTLFGANSTRIGGTNASDRNVISGNGHVAFSTSGGVFLTGVGDSVAGNFIGTTAGGNSPLGNLEAGIKLSGASFDCIGGIFVSGICTPSLAARNVISANGSGIVGASPHDNQIFGNYIGVGADGVTALGNNANGVWFFNSANNNALGGTAAAAQNRIAFNFRGVSVDGGAANSVRGNSIHSNGFVGIDLFQDGVTSNDPAPDSDTGPNNLQNFPVLTAAAPGASTTIQGTLTSAFNTMYTIDAYANNVCDGSGNGEGERWLGSGTVTTNVAGTGTINFAVGPTTGGEFVTATATDPSGNTSEFSACRFASNFNVDSTADANDALAGDGVCTTSPEGGVCTLRGAIQETNALAGAQTVGFNIPAATDPGCVAATGVCTMMPGIALPTISGPVTINGYSQPGASPNTNPITAASNAVLKIQLDGISAGNVTGLTITATGGSSTVRGLVINRFTQHGIGLTANGGNTIAGNYIGTDVQGLADRGNAISGVIIVSPGNTIGGTAAADRNVISGNNLHGIHLTGSTVTSNTMSGNFIGVGSDRLTSLGNSQNGVHIDSSAASNTIGGIAAGAANVVAFNGGDGVNIFAGGGTGNAIRGNSIHSNGNLSSHLGIDLGANGVTANDAGDGDTGPNNLQNFPVLTSVHSDNVGTTEVQGTLNSTASTAFTLDFYSSAACDAAGFGEGAAFIGSTSVTTDGGGNTGFNLALATPVPNGSIITATATGLAGSTSEFSQCLASSSAAATSLLSKGSGGQPANGISKGPDIGSNFIGPFSAEFSKPRFVGFVSDATNLVPGDSNGLTDGFVLDRQTGIVQAISKEPASPQLVGVSGEVSVTADGRYASFITVAPLVAADTNGVLDMYVRDLQTATTILVSKNSDGTASNGATSLGRLAQNPHAIFTSEATNLVPGDTNGVADTFVHDLQTGVTTRVSVGSGGSQIAGPSSSPSISPDAHYAGFITASPLVAADTNGVSDMYARDLQTATTILVSKSSAGIVGNGATTAGRLASNPHAVFTSEATNLVTGDGNGQSDIFVHALLTGVTTRESVATGSGEAAGPSDSASISGDRRCVAFVSSAANLVAGDTNNAPDVFVHDRVTGTTVRASVAGTGSQISGIDGEPIISSDCRQVAFASTDAGVVPGDTNGLTDVFLRDLGDIDGDGAPDPFDPCPAVVDCDGDGWNDGVERTITTNPALACANTPVKNDEPQDPWPPDTDDDTFVDTADIASLTGRFGFPAIGTDVRYDINVSGFIDTGDIGTLTNLFGQGCS